MLDRRCHFCYFGDGRMMKGRIGECNELKSHLFVFASGQVRFPRFLVYCYIYLIKTFNHISRSCMLCLCLYSLQKANFWHYGHHEENVFNWNSLFLHRLWFCWMNINQF